MSQLFALADDVPDGPYADNHRRRKQRDAAHMQQFRGGDFRADRTPTGHRALQRGAGLGVDLDPAQLQPPSAQGVHALRHIKLAGACMQLRTVCLESVIYNAVC